MKSFYLLFFICCSLSINTQKNKHSLWNQMLQKYVDKQGQVDYKSWLSEKKQLDAYIQTLERMPPLEMASKAAKLAYWINAYNALTIQLILENYPLQSIRDLDDPWNTNCFKSKDQSYTLGAIEYQILRKMDEARIHFAINCASASCPKLKNEAYQEKQLEAQLTEATRDFLMDTTKNKLSEERLQLSRIFLWFGNDFGSKADRLEFISQYSGLNLNRPKIDYLTYDWSLNQAH